MSLEELVGSITMALDACSEVISLQELLEIAIEQIDHPKKECMQSRTVLLLMCYLDRVKPHLEDLAEVFSICGCDKIYVENNFRRLD